MAQPPQREKIRHAHSHQAPGRLGISLTHHRAPSSVPASEDPTAAAQAQRRCQRPDPGPSACRCSDRHRMICPSESSRRLQRQAHVIAYRHWRPTRGPPRGGPHARRAPVPAAPSPSHGARGRKETAGPGGPGVSEGWPVRSRVAFSFRARFSLPFLGRASVRLLCWCEFCVISCGFCELLRREGRCWRGGGREGGRRAGEVSGVVV